MIRRAKFQKEYESALLNPPMCTCGCGGIIKVKEHHKWGRKGSGFPKFIHGHNRRDKTHAENSKLKMTKPKSEKHIINVANSNRGKKRTEKSRSLMSKSASNTFKNGRVPWNKGIPHTESTKEKLRKARVNQVIPFNDTRPERLLQEALTKEGITFKKHVFLIGQPDIFIEPNICIFVDGDYWHANPKKYDGLFVLYTTKKGKVVTANERWNKDKKVTDTLIAKDYVVLRFWENEINNNLSYCINIVKGVVK